MMYHSMNSSVPHKMMCIWIPTAAAAAVNSYPNTISEAAGERLQTSVHHRVPSSCGMCGACVACLSVLVRVCACALVHAER